MKTLSLSDSNGRLTGQKTRLRAKLPADAERDYQWQTDAEIAYLDATLPLRMTYSDYLKEYLKTLRHHSPTRRLFAIETLGGEHIGNCTYYGINEGKREAELGIVIGHHSYRDRGYGTDAVAILLRHIFSNTRLERITLKTRADNIRAQKCFLKCGFSPRGQQIIGAYHFLFMEINRSRWLQRAGKTSPVT